MITADKIESFLKKLLDKKINQANLDKPWFSGNVLACNYFSKRKYDLWGINSFILQLVQQNEGYKFNKWATFKQIADNGYKLKKGSEGVMVIFYKILTYSKENENNIVETVSKPFLRYSYVFNIDNIVNSDGISLGEINSFDKVIFPLPFTFSDTCPQIHEIDSSKAYYTPIEDKIILPFRSNFKNQSYFFHTLIHELCHATGLKNRTGRVERINNLKLSNNDAYALEEVIADLSASYVSSFLALEQDSELLLINSKIYIESWANMINAFNSQNRNFSYFIFRESSKAVEYLLKYFINIEGFQDIFNFSNAHEQLGEEVI